MKPAAWVGALAAAAAAAVVVVLAGCQSASPTTTTPSGGEQVVRSAVASSTPAVEGCPRPAPTSAAGYAALWATLPLDEWGGGDLSISVALPDERVLWLYADTFSTGRLVHSSAIVQDRGCLHVSRGGDQVLPNDTDRLIYWPDTMGLDEHGQVIVTARQISLDPSRGVWGFADTGHARQWRLEVDQAGDVTAVAVGVLYASPAPAGAFLACPGPRDATHVCYSRHTHPEIHLASRETLVTLCQNWTVFHPNLRDYAPIWSEVVPTS